MTCSELVTIPGWQYNRLPSCGQLSGGASPYGAPDMAGNVCERHCCATGGWPIGTVHAITANRPGIIRTVPIPTIGGCCVGVRGSTGRASGVVRVATRASPTARAAAWVFVAPGVLHSATCPLLTGFRHYCTTPAPQQWRLRYRRHRGSAKKRSLMALPTK